MCRYNVAQNKPGHETLMNSLIAVLVDDSEHYELPDLPCSAL